MTSIEVTPDQKKLFREKGYLYLPGALAKSIVLPIKSHVLNELKRLNVWSAGRNLSKKFKGVPIFQQTGKLGQLINYPDLNEKLVTRELYSEVSRLTGVPLSGQQAQLLISLPHKMEWTLEGLNWHRDVSLSRSKSLPGVQVFVLLDDVPVQGGATLALAGSHHGSVSREKRAISELSGHGVNRSVMVNGTEFSIVEMTGRAGDVYLMDMRLLHTPSINASRNVRMMATIRYFADSYLT